MVTVTAKIQTSSYILAGLGLLGVLLMGLLPALLAGLLIYLLVVMGAERLERFKISEGKGRVIVLLAILIFLILSLSLGVFGLVSHITAGPEGLSAVLHKTADVVAKMRNYMPDWAKDYLPTDMDDLQTQVSDWLRENAKEMGAMGHGALLAVTHVLFGLIIGGLVAVKHVGKKKPGPLTEALTERMERIVLAFRRVVFSQIRISALNTVLTAIFLFAVLPLIGSPIPLAKTLVAVTFVVGLLPVVGNLISNTIIVLIALGVSPVDAAGALIFLILIHKLEYFVNARIIGSQINARAWEMLLAMLVMDTALGLPGLVAAPIFYAYLKDELAEKNLI